VWLLLHFGEGLRVIISPSDISDYISPSLFSLMHFILLFFISIADGALHYFVVVFCHYFFFPFWWCKYFLWCVALLHLRRVSFLSYFIFSSVRWCRHGRKFLRLFLEGFHFHLPFHRLCISDGLGILSIYYSSSISLSRSFRLYFRGSAVGHFQFIFFDYRLICDYYFVADAFTIISLRYAISFFFSFAIIFLFDFPSSDYFLDAFSFDISPLMRRLIS